MVGDRLSYVVGLVKNGKCDNDTTLVELCSPIKHVSTVVYLREVGGNAGDGG